MNDDIVTRLRLLSASQKAHRFGDLMEDWSGEAADEIQRLRAEVQAWKNVAQELTMYAAMQEITEGHDGFA